MLDANAIPFLNETEIMGATSALSALPQRIPDTPYEHHLHNEIGSGRWGKVYRASVFHATFVRYVAVKVKVRKLDPQGYLEGWIHSDLYHPHVVDIHRHFTYRDWDFLVLELCCNGSLFSFIQKRATLTLFETRQIIIQLLGALKYIHGQEYVHRDVKPENIFFDGRMNLKLGDFGLTDVVSTDSPLAKYCGTSEYAAPEVIEPPKEGYGASCDFWSTGVLM
jgi:cell cycle serine/threonine-protein kinase CDC5/MSD2